MHLEGTYILSHILYQTETYLFDVLPAIIFICFVF